MNHHQLKWEGESVCVCARECDLIVRSDSGCFDSKWRKQQNWKFWGFRNIPRKCNGRDFELHHRNHTCWVWASAENSCDRRWKTLTIYRGFLDYHAWETQFLLPVGLNYVGVPGFWCKLLTFCYLFLLFM